jgi:hypothetical protein
MGGKTKMKVYNVTIQGITPLLMNRPSQLEISDKSKDVKRETKTSQEIAEGKLYTDAEGQVYMPSTWFRGALVEAGKLKKMSGKGSSKATYSKVVGSSVSIEPFELFLKNPKWETFTILAVNPTTRGRNPLNRPQFKKWEADMQVRFEEEQIESAVMKELFDIAGKMVGVGDWRPAKKGMFGKFQVVSWKEAKEK